MQKEIQELIDQREAIYEKWEESYNEKIMDYTEPEPPEIDDLGTEIRTALRECQDDLPVDFIIESLIKLGDSPNVVYDDNEHFAVSGDGYQPVSSEKWQEPIDITVAVEPKQWFGTIREALKHYMNS